MTESLQNLPERIDKALSGLEPRAFDTYVLPGFLMIYAYKSKGMRLTARRMLFSSGVWLAMRNYAKYKELRRTVIQTIERVRDEQSGTN